jgi:hypothetical protein
MEFEKIISEGATVFRKNLVLGVPTIAGGLAVSFLSTTVTKDSGTNSLLITGFISIVINLFAHGVTLAMANEALQTGTTSLGKGLNTAARYFISFLLASAIIGAIIGIGFALFFLLGLLSAFFLLFVLPSIVVDVVGPIEAIRRSVHTIRSNLKNSAAVFLFILSIAFFSGLAHNIIGLVPSLRLIFGIVLSGAFGGYVSVVVVKAYINLRSQPV